MSGKLKICVVFGTRPEAIKLAPVIHEIIKHPHLTPLVINTGQHKEMLDQMITLFGLKIDYNLNLMTTNQTLGELNAKILSSLDPIFEEEKPDVVLTQGDTTTAFAASLAAFYRKVMVGHVEAGLRSNHRYSPFPEEMNRKLISSLSNWNFAPTQEAADNLRKEGLPHDTIFEVGNTVVDALQHILTLTPLEPHPAIIETKKTGKKLILMTFHRREKFGEGFENVCNAVKTIANQYRDVNILYPVHLNPHVRKLAHDALQDCDNIFLTPPLSYIDLVQAMQNSHFVLTDSGGIQEEAPVLGKPVLVMRDVTERPEGVRAGVAKLVGTDQTKIVTEVTKLLSDEVHYKQMSNAQSLYGDGKSAQRIIETILKEFSR